eukprot:TRINITY_DN52459_c0_g1_i1.p1 TRINITY_DN52459_c0_g1~~TRINITY_DN52459_c0_g1_i1.p1  ORF type:complete len:159 (+),score=29.61 TRINITY_DN52459_c0_g1_i1:71-478(+)
MELKFMLAIMVALLDNVFCFRGDGELAIDMEQNEQDKPSPVLMAAMRANRDGPSVNFDSGPKPDSYCCCRTKSECNEKDNEAAKNYGLGPPIQKDNWPAGFSSCCMKKRQCTGAGVTVYTGAFNMQTSMSICDPS